MRIGVIGTGYVGLVTGSCLAHIGHQVIGLDIDVAKIEKLNRSEIPIFEPGLKELMLPLVNKNLFFTTELNKLNDVEAVFIAVGTPSRDDGSANMKYVFTAVENAAMILKPNAIIIMKSTVPVGTATKIRSLLNEIKRSDLMVVSNPEFLKEGAAVKDFLEPDRVIVGAEQAEAFDILDKIYAPLEKHNRVIKMSNVSAELTKYAANCFLATKISFMNEIAHYCEVIDANIEDVKIGIGSDPRIGSLFLNPGPGYGGSCFPKDVKALLYSAIQTGVHLQVVGAAEAANKVAKSYAVVKLERVLEELDNKVIAIWGLTFKAQTDDVRESSAIDVCHKMLEKKVKKLQVYDPEGLENFLQEFSGEVRVVASKNAMGALQGADALIILTEWNEFKTVDLAKLKSALGDIPVLDMRNLFEINKMNQHQIRYYSLGKN